MHKRMVASGAAIVLLVGAGLGTFGGQGSGASAESIAGPQAESGAVAHAFWVNRPESLPALTELSQSAVRATSISVAPGPSLTTSEPDVPPIPTQRVTFEVEDRWFGDVMDKFVLFKTGSADE